MQSAARPSRVRLLTAFAAVYIVWGSTYLAIRFAVETIPPFAMASARFLVSGTLLFLWTVVRDGVRPTRAEWRWAGITGVLLLLGGNGAVVWAEQRVPSGIAALMVAAVPLWMVLLDWLRPGGRRPRAMVFAGLFLGLVGLVVLVGPGSSSGGIDLVGAAVLVIGSALWAWGSLYSRTGAHPRSPLAATGMQMLMGGIALAIAAVLTGEPSQLHLAHVSTASWLGLAYLTTFGSMIGFTAYIYILRHSTPAQASTYAYVNPIVAVLLGWAIASEPITPRTLVAAAVILAGVAIITVTGGSRAPAEEPSPARVKAA